MIQLQQEPVPPAKSQISSHREQKPSVRKETSLKAASKKTKHPKLIKPATLNIQPYSVKLKAKSTDVSLIEQQLQQPSQSQHCQPNPSCQLHQPHQSQQSQQSYQQSIKLSNDHVSNATNSTNNQIHNPQSSQSQFDSCLSSFVIRTPKTWKILIDPSVGNGTGAPLTNSNQLRSPIPISMGKSSARFLPKFVVDNHGTSFANESNASSSLLNPESSSNYSTAGTDFDEASSPIAKRTNLASESKRRKSCPATPLSSNFSQSYNNNGNNSSNSPRLSSSPFSPIPKLQPQDSSKHVSFCPHGISSHPAIGSKSSFTTNSQQKEYTFVPDRRSSLMSMSTLEPDLATKHRSTSLSIPMPSSLYTNIQALQLETNKEKNSEPVCQKQCLPHRPQLSSLRLSQHQPAIYPVISMQNLSPFPSRLGYQKLPAGPRTLTFHQTEFDAKTLRAIDRPLESSQATIGPCALPIAKMPLCRSGYLGINNSNEFHTEPADEIFLADGGQLPSHQIEEAAEILIGLQGMNNSSIVSSV